MVEIDVNKENEEEPNFSDPEDYVDDIADEGEMCIRFTNDHSWLDIFLH